MSLMRGPNKKGEYEFSLDGEHWTTDRHQIEIEQALEDSKKLVSDVFYCARCGQNHKNLIFKKFDIPILDSDGEWRYWALCPVSHDPILLRQEAAQQAVQAELLSSQNQSGHADGPQPA